MKSLIGISGIALLGLAASAVVSLPAFANGGDFFNDLSESWGSNADTGVPYFGWVRDVKGKAIPRAIVTATVVGGADGEGGAGGGGGVLVGQRAQQRDAHRPRVVSQRVPRGHSVPAGILAGDRVIRARRRRRRAGRRSGRRARP